MTLSSIRQKINIKYFMVGYLGLLLILGYVFAPLSIYFLAGVLIIASYSFFDLLWTHMRDRVWYLPVSSWISALALAIVVLPRPSLIQIIALPFFAVLSKQLFHFGKTRHVLNPAAFSMALLGLFSPVVSWWAVSWGIIPLIIVSVVGLFILWRQRRFHITFSFLGSFALFFMLFSAFGGGGVLMAFQRLAPFLLSGPVIFFSSVMLIEPITSSFGTRNKRIVYGLLVGAFTALVSAFSRFIPQINLDPLITGLLLGNLSAALIFLPSRGKAALLEKAAVV
jgi:Na+-translocating ferredoxin:NAD+ oxidoreductase RnfD subunit